MRTRLLTGSAYIAVLAIFFLLKIFISDLFFDALIYLFALIGTFEMLRAMGERMTKAQKIGAYIFTAVCIPVCAILESGLIFDKKFGAVGATACFFIFAVYILSLLVARHEETTPENVGVSLFAAIYPTALLCLLCLCNHFDAGTGELKTLAFNSNLAILFIFVVSPFADSIAYVFGRFLKKYFPKKMAPVVSPNKTVIGGIGGLVGGLLGGGILYAIYGGVAGSYENVGLWLPIYLLISLFAAAATEFGDLVESCIKRKTGIKDMGKLLPGHGGILDRIDGTQFATMAVYISFLIIYAIF